MTPSTLFFWRRRKAHTSKRPAAPRRRVLELERLEDRVVPGQITQIQSFAADLTDIVNQSLSPTLQQFNTQGGTRTLDSVQITVSSSITSSLSGSVMNTGTALPLMYSATVNNAMTSVSGPGLSSPVSNSAPTLLSYGPITIAPGATMTIPMQTQTLTASGGATLTSPGDLAPFIGTGTLANYQLNASAVASDHLNGSANLIDKTTIATTGQASVTVVYTFDPTNDTAPEPSSFLLFTGLSLGLVSYGGFRKLRARIRSRTASTPELPGSEEPDA